MFIGTHAQHNPDRLALVMAASGQSLTYGELDEQSAQLAAWLLDHGLRKGERILVFMENRPEFLVICWAAFRAGLEVATPSTYSTPDELGYILHDSGAKALFASAKVWATAEQVATQPHSCPHWVTVDPLPADANTSAQRWLAYAQLIQHPRRPTDEEAWMGQLLTYTSGTTGRPKGVLRHLAPLRAWEPWPIALDFQARYGMKEDTVFLSAAPLYHGAPMLYLRAVHSLGGTAVIMEKFDEFEAMALIEKHRVTHSQWVPTMFVRMLKLPQAQREGFDLSSHRVAVHAAAPCPVNIKKAMIDWWGPILHEYYSATDAPTTLHITCEQWLANPGAVGEALPASVRICDDEGQELPEGQPGAIYLIPRTKPTQYLNDDGKTRASRHPQHPDWVNVGDIGYIKRGFLYLTDRKSFTIISGGVNIYPQLIEDTLIEHPSVMDAAVFGVPNAEMGEEVKAVVELKPGTVADDHMRQLLLSYCSQRLARLMVPKSLDFSAALPRTQTGKLMKRELRDSYWGDSRPIASITTGAEIA